MRTSPETATASERSPGGIGHLFDDSERKALFRKFLVFLGWIEVLIFASCWLYHLGNGGFDQSGPIEIPFPWKAYFFVSFLTPVAITFLIGIVIAGFNRYFADAGPAGETEAVAEEAKLAAEKAGRVYKLYVTMRWLQRLPFLSLLLLLGAGAGILYKLDAILSFMGSVGEKSVRVILMSGAIILAVGVAAGLILIVLNYRLRKLSMDYQYRSEMAERFGLIILNDNTVLNNNGKLLVQGKKWKNAVPLLPSETGVAAESEAQCDSKSTPEPAAHPADFTTS